MLPSVFLIQEEKMSTISYVRINDYNLPLDFQVTGMGPTRISKLPPDTKKILDSHPLVNALMKKYQKNVKQWADHLNIKDLSEDPLMSCVQLSERIVSKGYHKEKKLVMKDWELDILPPQIALFKNLAYLDLSGNHLRRLFPELPSLMELEELDISGNKVEIPDLSHLPKLRIIKANSCGLLAIPDWVQRCKSLELFECNNNCANINSHTMDIGIYD